MARRVNNYTMHLDTTTRREIKEICQAGRFVNSTAAAIRAVIGRYAELLQKQLTAESQGDQLMLLIVDKLGNPKERTPLQFRL
jgi:hypothetical protein